MSLHTNSRDLQEIVVRASAKTRFVPQQTIGRKAIGTLAANGVADALKYMAGVQIKDYGGLGGQKTVNVRSLGSQHVGVYIDGVRVTNAQNGTVDLGKYSLSTLESVSLFNANKNEVLMMASEYASAATIYLQTHKPDSSSLVITGSRGSFDTYKLDGTWMIADKKYGLSGFIDASFTDSRADYPFAYHNAYEDTTGRRRNSDIRMLRLEKSLWWKDFQWHTYYFNSERGLPGGIVRRLSDAYTDVGREWDRNFFSQIAYKRLFDSWGVRGILKYSNDLLHYRSDYAQNISVHCNNRYHQQDIYGAVSGTYALPIDPQWGELRLSASTDLRWSDLNCDVKNFHYVYRIDSKTSLATFYAYKGLNLSLGGLFTSVKDHNASAQGLHRFTYNALISYSFGNFTLRTFYKSVFRSPTLNDLYYTLVGNRKLRPEYTKQLDLGFVYARPTQHGFRYDIQFDAYYNRVTDRIVCLPLKGSYQWTMLNYGYTRCIGANVVCNMAIPFAHNNGSNHLTVSASCQDDRDLTNRNESSYNDQIAYSPRWSLTAVYSFSYKSLTASISHMFVDKRYWTAENAIEPALKPYNCTDVKIAYRFDRYKPVKSATIEVECQNLFDDRYEIIQRWPMPGRRYAVNLKLEI